MLRAAADALITASSEDQVGQDVEHPGPVKTVPKHSRTLKPMPSQNTRKKGKGKSRKSKAMRSIEANHS